MLKTSLPWIAITAILLVLFLLPQIPGKSPIGMTPANAWDSGVAILHAKGDPSLQESQAEDLLQNVTGFRAPKPLPAALLVELQEEQPEAGPHLQELQAALLQAARE